MPAGATLLSGDLAVDEFVVPPGETVYVDGDLRIFSRASIVVDGDIRCVDRNLGDGLVDAPTLTLVSEGLIYISGRVDGGDGCAGGHPAVSGGAGSTIVLNAPVNYIPGSITAGDGGDGGLGATGGAGGELHVFGWCLTDVADDDFELIGGFGGTGNGASGGSCGEPGDTLSHGPLHGVSRERTDPLVAEALELDARSELWLTRGISVLGATQFATAFDEQDPEGDEAPGGCDAVGRQGGKGDPGADGTSAAPNGMTGGTGRDGAAATGGTGYPGSPGEQNCPLGPGGTGGQGGAPGGAGGDPGDVGTGEPGGAGDGGNPGVGLAGGMPGDPGHDGSMQLGNPGAYGFLGPSCPQEF